MPEEDGGGGEEEEATRSPSELRAGLKLISDHVLVATSLDDAAASGFRRRPPGHRGRHRADAARRAQHAAAIAICARRPRAARVRPVEFCALDAVRKLNVQFIDAMEKVGEEV